MSKKQASSVSRHRRTLAAAVVALLAAAACGSSSNSSSGGGGSSGSTLTLGLVWSMSGEFSPYGQPTVDGARLAVQEVNDSGGIKVGGKTYKLSLSVQDDRSDSQTAVAATTQLIQDNRAEAILGPIGPLALPVAKITSSEHTLQITPSSNAGPLAGTSHYPDLFVTLPSNQVRAATAVEAIKAFLPEVKSIAIMGPTSATQQVAGPATVAALKSAGYTVRQFNYPTTTTDVSSVLTQVAAAKPDLIFMGWTTADWKLAASALGASGIPNSTAIMAYGGTAANASLFGGHPYIADANVESDFTVPHPTPAAAAFEQKLKTFLKTQTLSPNESASEFLYEGILLFAKGMQTAGTTSDVSKIAVALNTVSITGINGPISFRNNQINSGLDYTFVNHGSTTTRHFAR